MSDNGPDDRKGGQSSYLVLLAVIAGVALFWWLANLFYDWNKTQACVGYGKRNCAPMIELEKK